MSGSATHLGNSVYVKAKHRAYPYANLGASTNVSVWDNTLDPPSYRPVHYFGDNRPLSHFTVQIYRISTTSYESGLEDRHHSFTLWDGKTTFMVDRTGSDDVPRFKFSISVLEDEQYMKSTLSLDFNLDEAKSFTKGFTERESHRCVCCGRPVPTFRHLTRVTEEDPAEKISALYRLMRGLSARYAAAECRINPRTARFSADVDSNNLWAGEICAYNNASRDVWQVPKGSGKFNANKWGKAAEGNSSDLKKPVDREDETDESIFDDPSVVQLVRFGSVKDQVGKEKKKPEVSKKSSESTGQANSVWKPNGSLMDAAERNGYGKKRIRPTTISQKGWGVPNKMFKLDQGKKGEKTDPPSASQRSSPDLFIEEDSAESYTQVDPSFKVASIKKVISQPQPMDLNACSQEQLPDIFFETDSEAEDSGEGEGNGAPANNEENVNPFQSMSQPMEPQPDYAATPVNSKKYKSHSRKSTGGSNEEKGEVEASSNGDFSSRRKLDY